MRVYLIYVAHSVVTHIVVENSELKVHRNLTRAVETVWASGVNEVETDDDRVVKPDSTLALPAPHREAPGGLQAGGWDPEWSGVEADAVWLYLNMT